MVAHADHPPLGSGDILGPSEQFRGALDYYSHTKGARKMLARLAMEAPTTLARMHGGEVRRLEGDTFELELPLTE